MHLQLQSPNHRSSKFLMVFLAVVAIVITLSISSQLFPSPTALLAGGDTTITNRTAKGFSQPAPNLSAKEVKQHIAGDRSFEATFVTAPAPINAGLGPQFNNSSCVACHVNDGRGMPETGSLLLRVSLPPRHKNSAQQPLAATLDNTPPVPGLGTQIHDQAIYGVKPAAAVDIQWQEKSATYGDGILYKLRSPTVKITLPDGQSLPANMLSSLRLPPPVFGRGLLEAIPEKTIVAMADPADQNNDGISGKANHVWDVQQKALALGRFGLKANNPNLLQQNAAAYINDMGVTNPLFPEKDGSSEINAKTLKDTTFYVQTLAVPGRTMTSDPIVQRGEKLFMQANCAACHVAELRTGDHEIKAIANQTIHPYTDMLVHNMGEGLADGRPDFEADGNEWRTPPLWGLGLTQAALPYSSYLHDGRARSLAEAILWHGGEAEEAKEAFRNMPPADRTALIKFLISL
jgi:CxxC motif-containing protein (DUF1111 family)